MCRRLIIAAGAAAAVLAVPVSIALGAHGRSSSIALGVLGRSSSIASGARDQAAAAAVAAPAYTVRIEGKTRTLLLPTTVTAPSGSITRFGAPAGSCPGHSAMGILDAATHHRWSGTWSSKYNDYFIGSILGESYAHSRTYFWEIFADNQAASTGACEVALHPGEQLVFAAETGRLDPSTLIAPRSTAAGRAFKVKLVGYDPKGRAKPLAGVTVKGPGITPVKTDRQGSVLVTDSQPGTLVLRAAPKAYLRTEAVVHVTG